MKALGFLHDEQGARSMGRALMVFWSGFTAFLIVADAGPMKWNVPAVVYALLGTIFTGLLAWVAVPRAVSHLSGVAAALRGVVSSYGGGFGFGSSAPAAPAPSDDDVPEAS